jgi:hypothetical protein
MNRYNGAIKTKAQADKLANAIAQNHPNNAVAMGMVSMLRNNWQAVAARPAIQPEIIAMANTTGLQRRVMKVSKNAKKYIVVTPGGPVVAMTFAGACKIARSADRYAKATHGSQARADCHLVEHRTDGSYRYRGLIVGRRVIGETFGCGPHILQTVLDRME